jgi:uncharacterized protein (TIGR00297 family)
MLTKKGWVGAITIALFIIFSLGINYLIYPILFLILGSLASRLNSSQNSEHRNLTQVLSNGGAALICCIAYLLIPSSIITYAFILSFTIGLSDTLSSEVGRFYNGHTIDIIKLHKVKDGLSGGISLQGTLAGILGSMTIAFTSVFMGTIDIYSGMEIAFYGTLGMLADSILGSLIQAKYLVKNKVVEKGTKSDLISGYHWADNNVVNFLSILLTVCIYLVLH